MLYTHKLLELYLMYGLRSLVPSLTAPRLADILIMHLPKMSVNHRLKMASHLGQIFPGQLADVLLS